MEEQQANAALEKLNRGTKEIKQMVQLRKMELGQEYFGCSVETIKENRTILENLSKQAPWGREESFQIVYRELRNNYVMIERLLNEARGNVAELNTDYLRKQGELNATDVDRREVRKRGTDLTEVESTGSGGRMVVNDVRGAATRTKYEAAGDDEAEKLNATNAARHEAHGWGRDLARVEETGYRGLIILKDVLSSRVEA